MRTLRHLTALDVRRVAWKNGRGVTDELLVLPEGASFEALDFDVRISRATVSTPGPFSAFPGFDRVLVVTDGSGLRLSHGDTALEVRVGPLDPYAFSGDDPTSATLPDGPVSDFNVILRRGWRRADVRVLRPGARGVRERLSAGDAFVHALTGGVDVRLAAGVAEPSHRVLLAPGESALVRDIRVADIVDLSGRGSIAILVCITR